MIKVVCISGKAQHGKDTFANFAKEILEQQGNRVLIIHYADYLKYICSKFFDWDGNKDEKGRQLLQRIGTDVIREKDPSFWVTNVVMLLQVIGDQFDYVLIPDCRFPNEITYISQFFKTISIRITRPNFDNGLTQEQQKHISERALDNFKFDSYIENEYGLKEYKDVITDYIQTIMNKLLGE